MVMVSGFGCGDSGLVLISHCFFFPGLLVWVEALRSPVSVSTAGRKKKVGTKMRADSDQNLSHCFQWLIGGQGGIRTPGTVARTPHFECGAFNHSATCPS